MAPSTEWRDWEPAGGRTFDTIVYQQKYRARGGGVARILLNRPEKVNAFTPQMGDEMTTALLDANKDNSVGVIVLSHTGPHFGIGGDVSELNENVAAGNALIGGITPDTVFGRCMKPVLAAVRG